ncbi:MAG: purine-binding chemotaxis protein CheW [Prolixibacteraceae bacterium]|jgi:purine-binding chemotaxis protein CheW|nr:purine-binding chemotaxis protein CheW [Prolixibacteraceae bacterium]HOO82998.1 chemotaxis protein CheW [Prolixibacteraceae bacterium]HPR61141.1 chemotaxis protein CheW [Prolixibacteraceae bacterium]
MEEVFQTYLTFSLDKENFALDVEHVEKILEYQPVTEVPKAPEYMLGVFNLRGEVIPLVDTRIKFGMEKSIITSSTCVLVITINNEGETIKLGAMVDNVKEVIKYNTAEIKNLPSVGKQNKTEFLNGVLKVNDQFVLLLNADKIFSVDEIIELRAENFDLEA